MTRLNFKYVVTMEGVYRQKIIGVFDSISSAIKAANDMAAQDRDDYHTYDVIPVELNKAYTDTDTYGKPPKTSNLVEPEAIYAVSKKRVILRLPGD